MSLDLNFSDYFLIIRVRLCILGENTSKAILLYPFSALEEMQMLVCPIVGGPLVALIILTKMVCVRFLHCKIWNTYFVRRYFKTMKIPFSHQLSSTSFSISDYSCLISYIKPQIVSFELYHFFIFISWHYIAKKSFPFFLIICLYQYGLLEYYFIQQVYSLIICYYQCILWCSVVQL